MNVLKQTDRGWYASGEILSWTKIIIPTYMNVGSGLLFWAPYTLTNTLMCLEYPGEIQLKIQT